MLAYLKWKIINKFEDSIIIEINGCFGLKIYVPHPENFDINSESTIRTVLIIREDSFNIFGFKNENEIKVFNLLTSIPKMSSKVALNILSKYSPDEISNIVTDSNFEALKKVAGIGEKSARKIILYLSEKLNNFDTFIESPKINNESYIEAKNALTNLGLSTNEAKNLLNKVLETNKDIKNSDFLIKEAIKLMKNEENKP
ncbi:MAG: Holliday junction ATP-dependent DNA helicase RuvA [Caldisericia bacterium]|nr:Holliday junction ATP-dependent DNA helicase RuvA [Caldisericia bacterium]